MSITKRSWSALQRAALCGVGALLATAPLAAADYHVRDRDAAALAAAIRHANQSPGADVIMLSRGGLYPVLHAASDGLALPVVTDALRIEGRGAEIRRYTDSRLMLLTIAPGARLELRDLTLAEGARGAIHNRGELVLQRVRVTDSTSSAPAAIVLNEGVLHASESEFGFNQLLGADGDGGTLVNRGRMRLTDSRIVDNSASRSDPLSATAAVLNLGSLELDGVVVAGNRLEEGLGSGELMPVLNLLGGESRGEVLAAGVR